MSDQPKLRFEVAWRRDDPKHANDATAYWKRLGIVEEDELAQRVKELILIVYDGDKAVAAATADIKFVQPLRQKFAMCRSSVDPDYRRKGLGTDITAYYRVVLEAWFNEHREENVMGFGVRLSSAELVERQRDPLWMDRGVDLVLVGYTENDEQMRIGWFRHARV